MGRPAFMTLVSTPYSLFNNLITLLQNSVPLSCTIHSPGYKYLQYIHSKINLATDSAVRSGIAQIFLRND